MMALAAAYVRSWLDMGIPFQHVDVSCADVHDGTLEALLADAFGTAGVPLKQVVIEGTETVYMGDGGRSVPKGGRGTARHGASRR
jgi:EAL domain-containing protein (putative c-di-GMP-specific phosphodiesterase class I)